MFYKTENSTLLEIEDNAFGFVYKCYIPEFGYGINSMNGKKEKTDVIQRSEIPEECYWERQKLPADYDAKRKIEAQRQKIDKLYFDPYLEQIRHREWGRRLRGVWFANYNPKTKQVEHQYITGVNYLYINNWKFQGKFMDFRIADRNLWYVVDYCAYDPDSLGVNEITKRKNGKTARVGCWLFERTSRLNNHHGGIQSKADDDAWEVFKKAVVHPWKTLPHYWRPTYDLMKGDDPNDELRFFATSRRGQSAENEEQEEALNSFIDFKSSIESAYDGPELHSYVSDEAGKTKRPVSIKERQSVVRYCSEIDGEFKGKQWYTTTVEIDEGEEDNYEFQDLTAKSNPLDRDDNNRTGTGLYTYFLPAQYGMYFDKYGYADVERATIFLLNTRKKLEEDGDTRGLSSFKRKNPMSFKEAFSIDGKNSLYNPEVLNNQLDDISWKNNLTELGDLEWKDGYAFERPVVKLDGEIEYVINEIVWRPNPNGKFEKVIGWWPKEANKVYKNGVKFLPNNNYSFRIGCDPFKYDKTKDKRRSNCAAFAYQMPDDIYPDTNYDDMFTLRYAQRRDSTKLSNEDVLKMAWLCGCQVLFERNVNHWKRDFQDWNCDGFLMWLPGEVEPGIYTDGKGTVVQMICNYTESYINKNIKKVFFKTLIRKDTGWLGFKVDDTQVFDEPIAAGITLIAVKGRKYAKPTQINKDVESILPYNKAI